MAKVFAGILGSFAGKVAGVVGGRWKNIQYVRAYVIPANPDTDAQQAKRLRFKLAALFGMSILAGALQPYMDPFVRGMSAFNWFIKKNIALFVAPVNYLLVQVTSGPLYPAPINLLTPAGVDVAVTFGAGLGANGLATDKVFAIGYNETTGRCSQAAAEVARSTGAIDVIISDGLPADTIDIFLITCRRDPAGNITSVGNSAVASCNLA
jgi:hypothetical protein